MDLSKLNLVWDSALNFIEQRIADYNVFATFFKDTKLLAVEGDNAYIEVSSKFAKELIQSRYLDYITSALEEVTKKNYKGILKIKNEERDFTFQRTLIRVFLFQTLIRDIPLIILLLVLVIRKHTVHL